MIHMYIDKNNLKVNYVISPPPLENSFYIKFHIF